MAYELSPCELLRLEAAVRILTNYLLSLPPAIVDGSEIDDLGGNGYNLHSVGDG
jgi:hypothetical protein